MCILWYVKLIGCNGVAEMYVHLREGWGQSTIGICAFCYMWNLLGVMVLYRSMFNWRRGWGSVCTGICAFFYVLNLFSVVVFQRSMVNRRRGWGLSSIGICAFFYMWNLWGVMVLHRSMLDWRMGRGVSLPWVDVHSVISETLCLFGGGVGSVCTGISAFCCMWNFISVVVFHRSMVNRRRVWWGLSALV